jgi:hypothetical protein
MLKGAVFEEKVSEYIYMNQVFSKMRDFYQDYNWLITDYDCFDYPSKNLPKNERYIWLTGIEVEEVIEHTQLPFIWGVFSGFNKKLKKEEVLLNLPSNFPIAEGCEVWKSDFQIQHPLAQIEMIAWEGTYIVLLSKKEELIHSFRDRFPESEDLYEYNKSRGW